MNHKHLSILIVSYYYPPRNTVGALRPYSFAKYWSRMGHDVRVVTSSDNSAATNHPLDIDPEVAKAVEVEEVDHFSLKRFLAQKKGASRQKTPGDPCIDKRSSKMKRISQGINRNLRKYSGIDPHSPHFFAGPAIQKAMEMYGERPFDIVVSSYGPPASHLVASSLKRKLGIFWVADYRDLWSDNYSTKGIWPFSFMDKQIEKWVVNRADMITADTEAMSANLTSMFGEKVHTISNGCDIEELKNLMGRKIFPNDGKKRLIYCGTVYRGMQDPEPLVRAVATLKARLKNLGEKFEIRFYGKEVALLPELITKYAVNDVITISDLIDRKSVLLAQRQADLLLLLGWEGPGADGMLTVKSIEYLYAGTPVIQIGGGAESITWKLIEDAGVGVVMGKCTEEIAGFLEAFIGGERIKYQPRKQVLEQYTREFQAKKMLNKIVDSVSRCSG